MKAASISQTTSIVAYTWPTSIGRPIVERVLERIGEIASVSAERPISHMSEILYSRQLADQAVRSLEAGAAVIIDNRGYPHVAGIMRHKAESELGRPELLDRLFMLFPEDN